MTAYELEKLKDVTQLKPTWDRKAGLRAMISIVVRWYTLNTYRQFLSMKFSYSYSKKSTRSHWKAKEKAATTNEKTRNGTGSRKRRLRKKGQ